MSRTTPSQGWSRQRIRIPASNLPAPTRNDRHQRLPPPGNKTDPPTMPDERTPRQRQPSPHHLPRRQPNGPSPSPSNRPVAKGQPRNLVGATHGQTTHMSGGQRCPTTVPIILTNGSPRRACSPKTGGTGRPTRRETPGNELTKRAGPPTLDVSETAGGCQASHAP